MSQLTDDRPEALPLTPSTPPTHPPDRSGIGLAVLRIVIGITWLHEAQWKTPPEFGGLADWVTRPLENPTFAPWNSVIEAVVLPNLQLFGWITLLTEAALGAFLIVGLGTRLFALIGIAQATAIALSVVSVPGEWSYAYYIFIAAHVALLTAAAGRTAGIDGVLRDRWRRLAATGGPSGRVADVMWRIS